MKRKLKVFDFIVLFVFLVVIFGSFILAGNKKSKGAELTVRTPEGTFIYPLDKNRELDFEGLIGHTKVIIKDGQAWVTDSPCENKTCILMGKLSASGGFAACLPNSVILSVEGQTEELDALVK